jgi:hypothetical protein
MAGSFQHVMQEDGFPRVRYRYTMAQTQGSEGRSWLQPDTL